ncbi:winged helix-turn-helix domain-containing protein, partial [Rhizobium viscosum]
MIDATTYCFGNCRFTPARQSLLCGDIPIRLGSRAMDLLHALVRQPGQVVKKSELFEAAWPNLFVDESNLKVNIAALRRALQTSGVDVPCIATVPGRGYRFVAPLTVLGPREATLPASIKEIDGALPPSKPLVGRADALAAIVEALQQTRLLTVVGPAGVGKTSIAIAAARAIANGEDQAVCFVDLAAIEKGQFVALAVSRALGIVGNPIDDVEGLV